MATFTWGISLERSPQERETKESVMSEHVGGSSRFPLDAVLDDAPVDGHHAGMVRDEECSTVFGHVFESIPFDSKPVSIERVEEAVLQSQIEIATPAVEIDVGEFGFPCHSTS